ncbi:MAG: winged helix DNA-binding domain-containing protein [Acidimicrobiia bacterium]
MSVEERRARLAARHFLSSPAGGVEEVAKRLVAYHSTDPTTVYLSALARIPGFQRSDLDAALYDRKSLVRVVGMRRTLWVVPRDEVPAVHNSSTRSLIAAERKRTARMVEEGGIASDGNEWLHHAEKRTIAALRARGEAVATDLTKDVPELAEKITFYKKDGSVLGTVGMVTRILFLLATEGKAVRARPKGTWVSGLYRWAPMEAWLGTPIESIDAVTARASLLDRWLLAFGPGTETDIGWWTGWTKTHMRAALESIGAIPVEVDGGPAWISAADEDGDPSRPRFVRLLPSLDPTTMGWKQREWYLGEHEASLFDRNGNAGPTVWVDGRIVGAWAVRKSGEIAWELVESVPAARIAEIEIEAVRLGEWLEGTVVSPRFASPLHNAIRG